MSGKRTRLAYQKRDTDFTEQELENAEEIEADAELSAISSDQGAYTYGVAAGIVFAVYDRSHNLALMHHWSMIPGSKADATYVRFEANAKLDEIKKHLQQRGLKLKDCQLYVLGGQTSSYNLVKVLRDFANKQNQFGRFDTSLLKLVTNNQDSFDVFATLKKAAFKIKFTPYNEAENVVSPPTVLTAYSQKTSVSGLTKEFSELNLNSASLTILRKK